MKNMSAIERIFREIMEKGKDVEVEVASWGRLRAREYRGYYAFLVNGTGAIYDGSDVVLVNGEVIDPKMNMKILYDYPVKKLLSDFDDVVDTSWTEAIQKSKKTVNPWLTLGHIMLTIIAIYYLFSDKKVGVVFALISSIIALARDVYYRRGALDIMISMFGVILFGYYFVVMFLK